MNDRFATKTEVERIGVTCDIDGAIRVINSTEKPGKSEWAKAKHLCPAGGPLLMAEDGHAVIKDDDSHSVCFASTGRGKTRRHVYPMMMSEILSGSNVIVNDMKGEILETMRPLLDRMGYTTYVLDLRKPAESPNRYNPLSIAWDEYHFGDKDAAFTYLRSFGLSIFSPLEGGDDPYWPAAATDYFLGLALGMLEAGVERDAFTIENVAYMDRYGNEKSGPRTALKEFFDSLGEDSIAHQFASGTIYAPRDTQLSIVSVFRQPMSLYLGQQGLMDALSRSDFSVQALTLEKRAIFVVSPDETHALGPVVVGIINQIMSALISHAQAQHGGSLPRRVDFVLDEFGNLPTRVPDMGALVSAARSRNIRLHLVLQSDHQLSQVYGEDLKEVILDNIDTWLYMGSRSYKFARHLSELAGETTLPSGKVVPLMSVPQLQHLESRQDVTETLVFAGSLRPYVTALRDVGTYEVVPPTKSNSPVKRRIKRIKFDIREAADQARTQRMEKLIQKTAEQPKETKKPKPRRMRRIENRINTPATSEERNRHNDEGISAPLTEQRVVDFHIPEEDNPRT